MCAPDWKAVGAIGKLANLSGLLVVSEPKAKNWKKGKPRHFIGGGIGR